MYKKTDQRLTLEIYQQKQIKRNLKGSIFSSYFRNNDEGKKVYTLFPITIRLLSLAHVPCCYGEKKKLIPQVGENNGYDR